MLRASASTESHVALLSILRSKCFLFTSEEVGLTIVENGLSIGLSNLSLEELWCRCRLSGRSSRSRSSRVATLDPDVRLLASHISDIAVL